MIFHDVFSIDDAHNKALKVERLQSRASPFRQSTPIEESASDVGVQLSFTTVDCQPARHSTNAPAPASAKTITAAAKSKENPYAKPRVGKCYTCREPGHIFNECFKKKQVNMANYEDEEKKRSRLRS